MARRTLRPSISHSLVKGVGMALKTCLGGTGGIISTYQSLQTDIQMESFFVINPIISTISDRYRSRQGRHLPSFFSREVV